MSGIGDIPNFSFTIEGVDHQNPPYYIDAIRTSTNRLRYYVDNPFFAAAARAMVPYTGILLEADAVGFHIAQESKRLYAASCIGSHTLSRSTVFGPMPDVARTLDIPKPIPGASAWTIRAFRQNYELIKATADLMNPRTDNDYEATAVLWDKAHGLLQKLLTAERIEIGIKMITATQAYPQTKKPALLDGYIQSREDPHSFVNFVDGTFAHVWRDAREARRFVASSQRLWQTIMEHRLIPVLCPITVMMQSRGKSITFTPLVPIHGDAVDDELAPTDILRLLSALIGNTGGHHRFGQQTAKMTDNGEAEEMSDVKDQPLAAPAANAGMYAGADGYYYITRPTAFGIILEHLRGGKTIAVPYGPLRLEAYHRVFPDGVSKERGWTANQAVERIMGTAFEPVVKTLVKRARNKVTDLVQRGFIAALFRQYGLNIRFAFLVLKEALTMVNPRTPEEMAITDALEAEMLCRAIKTMYRADVAITPGVLEDEDYLERANRLLYYVNSGSMAVWEQMSTVVRGKFLGCPSDYSIPPSPKLARILTWYMTPKMGFNFNAEEGMFDKVSAALPVWYGCYSQPESVRLVINNKLDAAANHLGQQWQWLEGVERPPVMAYQKAVEVGRWKKINAHLAPEDPHAQDISEDGQRLDISVTHQQHRSQVFELLSHSVRILGLTRLCQIEDQVVQMRLVKALDTALRYRNTNSAVFAHLCSLLIDALSFEAKELSITHPIADIFEDTCRTVYFYGTRLVQSMCINFAKIQGDAYEGTRTGNLFFISQALLTAGGALTRDAAKGSDAGRYRPYSAAVNAVTGVTTDAPALYDYPAKARAAVKLSLKASRGAQYTHAGMTLKLHYHSGRVLQIANRVLSRPRIEEHTPAYIDFRVNPELLEQVLRLSQENITLRIIAVSLLTHMSHMLGAHLDIKERQREEMVKLSKEFFAQTKDERRFITDELFVGLSMAAFQYRVDIPCSVSDEDKYSDAEVVTAFTRLLAVSLLAVEQVDNKFISPIVECYKAVNKVYPIKAKKTGLFFTKQDFDLIKSSIQSPMFARNLSVAMDEVLLVRRMWVVLNTIRLIYYKGAIIYDKDEDLDEAVSVADWCNKMADVQRAYAYRRLNGRFPDDTVQRQREIEQIKHRLDRDSVLYDIGIQTMEIWQRHTFEQKHHQHWEDAKRRALDREAEEWCYNFHKTVFDYKQSIGVTTCQMEELLARVEIEKEECVAAEEVFRVVDDLKRTAELEEMRRQCDTSAGVMHCEAHLEPYARNLIEIEQINAIGKIIVTTYYCYCLMPALYKNGYMRDALRSYEECIVMGSRQLILDDEHAAFTDTINDFNAGYYGDAMTRLLNREADLRKRMIIHERATFNASVFTPIETMSRALVAEQERLEWLQIVAHPHQILTEMIVPEEEGRAAIEAEQLASMASLIYDFSLHERHEIASYGGELRERTEVLCPLHEAFERCVFVETPCYEACREEVLIPMEASARHYGHDLGCGVFGEEAFYRMMIADEEHCYTQRDLLYQMAAHRLLDVIGAEEEGEFLALYERYQLESGQFRAADFEEYESVLRQELSERYLSQCLQEIVVAKCTDLSDVMLGQLTAMLLEGTAEREAIARREIEATIGASERAVYYDTMLAFEEDLTAKELWERARFMAVHAVILEEYDSRTAIEAFEARRYRGIMTASEVLLQQLRGLDSLKSAVHHNTLCPLVSRHWPRVVAEQRHADANAFSALPLDAALAAEEGGDKYGGPLLGLMAQREGLRLMKETMPEPDYDEIRLLMEEGVRRNEILEWYCHFIATARAESENIIILMTERSFPDTSHLLSCVPTAASVNVAPLLLQPAHVVSRVTAHGRRLVLTVGHEMQRVHDAEMPQRAALAKRHREILVELRKPPHRRSRRVLLGMGAANRNGVDLTPILETGLMPLPTREVPDALAALSTQQFHLLKLLLYEDTLPVEMTLRLRLQVAEHRAAMGIYREMKEAEGLVGKSNGAAAARRAMLTTGGGGGAFAALNASLHAASNKQKEKDLALIPIPMIHLARAIAEGRYYHTAADDDEAIAAGASIRPSLSAKKGTAVGYGGRGPPRGEEEGGRVTHTPQQGEEAPFDVTTLPKFRVFEDCHDVLPLPGYTVLRPMSGMRRPSSASGRRRGTGMGSRPGSANGSPNTPATRNSDASPLGTSSNFTYPLAGGMRPSSSSGGRPPTATASSRPTSAAALDNNSINARSSHHTSNTINNSVPTGLHPQPQGSAFAAPLAVGSQPYPHRLAPLRGGGGGGGGPPYYGGEGEPPIGVRPMTPPPVRAQTPPVIMGAGQGGGYAGLNNTVGHMNTFSPPPTRFGDGMGGAAVGHRTVGGDDGTADRLNHSAPAKSLVGGMGFGGGAGAMGGLLSPVRRPQRGVVGGPRGLSPSMLGGAGGGPHYKKASPTSPQQAAAAASQNAVPVSTMDPVFVPANGASSRGLLNTTTASTSAAMNRSASPLVFHKRTAKPNRLPTLL